MRLIILTRNSINNKYIIERISRALLLTPEIVYENNDDGNVLQKRLKREIKRNNVLVGILKFVIFTVQLPILVSIKLFEGRYITRSLKVDLTPIYFSKEYTIDSVNNEKWINTMNLTEGTIILVMGTRIIADNIIKKVKEKCLLVNWHAGITPKYRGVQSEFYCVLNNELNLVGSTLHFVDKGIDTGCIIKQRVVEMSKIKKQNMNNYCFLRIQNTFLFIKMFANFFEEAMRQNIKVETLNIKESTIYSTPNVYQYLKVLFKNMI